MPISKKIQEQLWNIDNYGSRNNEDYSEDKYIDSDYRLGISQNENEEANNDIIDEPQSDNKITCYGTNIHFPLPFKEFVSMTNLSFSADLLNEESLDPGKTTNVLMQDDVYKNEFYILFINNSDKTQKLIDCDIKNMSTFAQPEND